MEVVGVKVLPHELVLALAFMLDALMWQLEFPHFTPLVSWKEKAKCNKSTQHTQLITHSGQLTANSQRQAIQTIRNRYL